MAGSLLMLVGILISLTFAPPGRPAPTTSILLALYDTPLSQQAELWLSARSACLRHKCRCSRSTHGSRTHTRGAHGGERDPGGRALTDGGLTFLRFACRSFRTRRWPTHPGSWGSRWLGSCTARWSPWFSATLKKLVAYSSVSHLGFVMLGLFVWNTQGLSGGILQSVTTGLDRRPLPLRWGSLRAPHHRGRYRLRRALGDAAWFAALS